MNVGRVNSFDASCVVPNDPGEVVRGSRPLTAEDRVQLADDCASGQSVAPDQSHDEMGGRSTSGCGLQ